MNVNAELAGLAELVGLMLLAALSVGLWTVRVAVTAAGRKVAAATVAGAESLVFVVAMGTVLTSLGEPLRLLAYALGVGSGTLVGILVDERLSTGQSLVQVLVEGDGERATAWLRAHGWPATCSRADGLHGAVAVLSIAVEDRALRRLTADLDGLLPEAFRAVERLREVHPAHGPAGLHQPRAGGHRARRRPATTGRRTRRLAVAREVARGRSRAGLSGSS
jgi:uncharacterized protein YebE (UPF0316 family)